MAKVKLRHVSGKIVTVDKAVATRMQQSNPGKYEEIKAKKSEENKES